MSGMSDDDQSKELIYRAINSALIGADPVKVSEVVYRGLKSLRDTAILNHDDKLVSDIDHAQRQFYDLNFSSQNLSAAMDDFKMLVYRLETY